VIGWHFACEGFYKLTLPGWTRSGRLVGARSTEATSDLLSPQRTVGIARVQVQKRREH
jgi:hypothetical protein